MLNPTGVFLAAQAAALKAAVNQIQATATLGQQQGTPGNDVYRGSKGADRFNGGAGDDVIYGDGGNDELYGGKGDDVIDGGKGNDTLSGNLGDDKIFGGDGNDRLSGGDGDDLLLGGKGADLLDGGSGVNIAHGQEGNDKLVGARDGSGTLDGGTGDDVFNLAGSQYTIVGGEGFDTLDLSSMPTTGQGPRKAGVGFLLSNGFITGNEYNTYFLSIEKFVGTSGADHFYLGGLDDFSVYGGKGDDFFFFDSYSGNFSGDEGNDTYFYSKNDTSIHRITYKSGHDTLMIQTTKKYTIESDGQDIIVSFRSPDEGFDRGKIIVSGAAEAYKKGLFGIAQVWEAPETGFYNVRAVGGAVNLSLGENLVGGAMNDTFSVYQPWALFQYDTSVMTGGGGSDTFILGSNGGTVRVTDYRLAQRDKIIFDETTGVRSFKQLTDEGVFNAAGFQISVATGANATTDYFIAGVDRATLTKAYNDGLILF